MDEMSMDMRDDSFSENFEDDEMTEEEELESQGMHVEGADNEEDIEPMEMDR